MKYTNRTNNTIVGIILFIIIIFFYAIQLNIAKNHFNLRIKFA